jgi:O-antigen/teichoic acid export membrane protein
MTASALINPLLNMLDRFLVGAVQGASAVTYYSIPYQFATKFSILPDSLTCTLFPRLAMYDRKRADAVAGRVLSGMAALTAPVAILGVLVVRPFLRLWLGASVAQQSSRPGEILLAGVWIMGLASVASTLLQAQGHPDLTVKVRAAQVLPFMAVLWAGLRLGGVQGAASAWTLRVAVDAALLFWVAGVSRRIVASLLVPSATVMAAVFVAGLGQGILPHAIFALVLLPIACWWMFRAVPDIIQRLAGHFRAARGGRVRSGETTPVSSSP